MPALSFLEPEAWSSKVRVTSSLLRGPVGGIVGAKTLLEECKRSMQD